MSSAVRSGSLHLGQYKYGACTSALEDLRLPLAVGPWTWHDFGTIF